MVISVMATRISYKDLTLGSIPRWPTYALLTQRQSIGVTYRERGFESPREYLSAYGGMVYTHALRACLGFGIQVRILLGAHMYTFKEHLDDIISWLQTNGYYNADTLSWALTFAYERFKNKQTLFSIEIG